MVQKSSYYFQGEGKVQVLVTELCPTLCDPLDPPGSSVRGILQARILEWVAIPFRGIFLTRGSNPSLLPCQQVVYLSCQGSPKSKGVDCKGSKVVPRSPLPAILGFRHLWRECGNHRDTQPAGGPMAATTTTIINNLPEFMGKCWPVDTAHRRRGRRLAGATEKQPVMVRAWVQT